MTSVNLTTPRSAKLVLDVNVRSPWLAPVKPVQLMVPVAPGVAGMPALCAVLPLPVRPAVVSKRALSLMTLECATSPIRVQSASLYLAFKPQASSLSSEPSLWLRMTPLKLSIVPLVAMPPATVAVTRVGGLVR